MQKLISLGIGDTYSCMPTYKEILSMYLYPIFNDSIEISVKNIFKGSHFANKIRRIKTAKGVGRNMSNSICQAAELTFYRFDSFYLK